MKKVILGLLVVSLLLASVAPAFAMNKSELIDRLAERYESVGK